MRGRYSLSSWQTIVPCVTWLLAFSEFLLQVNTLQSGLVLDLISIADKDWIWSIRNTITDSQNRQPHAALHVFWAWSACKQAREQGRRTGKKQGTSGVTKLVLESWLRWLGGKAGSGVGAECRKAQDGYMADRTGMLTACRVVTQVLTQGV
jgi:hypothetical protein